MLKPGAASFGLNLFATSSEIGENERKKTLEQVKRMQRLLKHAKEKFGLPIDEDITEEKMLGFKLPTLDEQMPAIIEARPEVVSWTFGKELFPKDAVRELRNNGTKFIGTATTVEEAVLLEQLGADAIVAQGSEAGGHRGTFLHTPQQHDINESLIGTMALLPAIVDAVSIPVIAAGGISDRRGVVASLALGASAVQVGTAFLYCQESSTSEIHRTVLEKANQSDTIVTRAFTGRYARGFNNRYVREMRKHGVDEPGFRFNQNRESEGESNKKLNKNVVEVPGKSNSNGDDIIPPYPIPQFLTGPIKSAAVKSNDPQYPPMWAGQGFKTSSKALDTKTPIKAEDVIIELMALVDAMCSTRQ